MATSLDYQVVPLTTAPFQRLAVTLGVQSCSLNVYTKSINAAIREPGTIATDPPIYRNTDPLFLDLFIVPVGGGNLVQIIAGAQCHNAVRLVRDTYLGFIGDLAFYDTIGTDDPFGVPNRLPPYYLQNAYQMALPRGGGGRPSDTSLLGTCPGLGTRFILTYWPDLT